MRSGERERRGESVGREGRGTREEGLAEREGKSRASRREVERAEREGNRP